MRGVSLENGFRFSPQKCEIVAPEGVETTGCTLYGRSLVRSPHFTYLGMKMTVKGIDSQSHVARLASKAVDATNILRSIGFNGNGYSIEVKRRIYETFIRPKLEYGLHIIRPDATTLRLLSRAQGYAMHTMMGVGRTCSRAALRALTGIQSMRQRWHELNASFFRRTKRLGSQYMIYHARVAHDRRHLKRSVFTGENENPMVRRYRDQTDWRGRSRVDEIESVTILRTIRTETRHEDFLELWKPPSSLQVALIDRRRHRTARWVEGLLPRRTRRCLLLWILRRLIGRPRTCCQCLLAPASIRHAQACSGMDVDGAIWAGQFVLAAERLVELMKKCLGYQVGNHVVELAMAGAKSAMPAARFKTRCSLFLE